MHALLLVLATAAAEDAPPPKRFEPYGFVRADAIFDSRPMDNAHAPFVVARALPGLEPVPELALHPRLTRIGFERIETGDLIETYANSASEDTRRKAEKYGAHGTTVKAFKPGR